MLVIADNNDGYKDYMVNMHFRIAEHWRRQSQLRESSGNHAIAQTHLFCGLRNCDDAKSPLLQMACPFGEP